MKLAILADIHANFIGLQTVTAHLEAWAPDLVIVGGDVVNRGPRPLECLNFVLAKQQHQGWLMVRGNHEDYVMAFTDPAKVNNGLEYEIHQMAHWTYRQLHSDVTTLAAMPFQQCRYTPDGQEVRVVHGSMLGNRNGIFPKTPDEELRRQIGDPPQVLVVGHTHWPFIRTIDETLVVNVGSAGLPFDGDDRVSYAQLRWQRGEWQAEIIRLAYDKARNERDFFESGFMADSGPLAPLVFDELRTARSRIYRWVVQYEAQVLAGDLTAEAAVRHYLANL
jgi:putative phosphoesterase